MAEGGPLSLIDDGKTGLLRPPQAGSLAAAVCDLAGSPALRESLAREALAAVRERTWERALELLADGYRGVLGETAAPRTGVRAA